MNFFKDIHCHCLPGLDDGPQTMSEAVSLCRALVADGIETVVAAPHMLGRFDGMFDARDVRSAAISLNGKLKDENIDLTVLPGGEIRLDERICSLLDEDRILTLAGSRYLLLELLDNVTVDISFLITELKKKQINCIVAHPERHSLSIPMAKKWFSLGASLQVTASSLLGKGFLGPEVQKPAWRLLEAGLVSIIATDAHDLGLRRPMMKAAYDSISARLGTAIANLLLIENPARLIKGDEMIAAGTESQPLKADS